ncbi:hypothetical protein [Winogradskyella eximia]|uniref:hypothetical protein n=1 Tax=Winogradskyella eximia TaxID=262006 RepID=UPI002492D2E9|nr:hypothetical protein [Winogradskyella eximia]
MDYTYKNIDTDYIDIPNGEIFFSIQKIIKNEFPGIEKRDPYLLDLRVISYLINHITIDELLLSTVGILKEFGILKDYQKIIKSIDFKQIKRPLTQKEFIRATAFITSSLLEYECLTIYDKSIHKPEFKFSFKDDRTLKFNSDEWYKNFRDNLTEAVSEFADAPSKEKRKLEYKKILEVYHEAHLKSDLDLNKNIDYLYNKATKSISISSSFNEPENINLHPRIFTSVFGYRLFEALINRMINNKLADCSFIFRKMLKDGYIFNSIGDSEFRTWLYDAYQIDISKTKRLYLCTTVEKQQLYSEIKENIKQQLKDHTQNTTIS